MKRFAAIITLLVVISAAILSIGLMARSFSSPIQVSAAFDRRSALIGDAVRFSVKAAYDGRVGSVEIPDIDDKFSGFEVLSKGEARKKFFGKASIIKWYTVTSYEPAAYAIPAIEVLYKRADGTSAKISTAEAKITIKGVLKEDEKRKFTARIGGGLSKKAVAGKEAEEPEAAGPSQTVDTPIFYKIIDQASPFAVYTTSEIAIVGGSGLLIIFILILVIILTARRIGRKVPLSPFQAAMKRLAELEGKNMAEKIMDKEFYFELSSVLRDYLKFIFKAGHVELTTLEFLDKIDAAAMIDENRKKELKGFFKLADLVKYSGYMPQAAESQSAFDIVKQAISDIDTILKVEEKKA